MGQAPQRQNPLLKGDKLLKAYLLLIAAGLIPIALSYGTDPAATLPRFLDIRVEGADQKQIFRALMSLYLGASAFWAMAAFIPSLRRAAAFWGVIFMFSLAFGRLLSLIVDGPASRLLDIYLAAEILGGVLGVAALHRARKAAA
ncbi:MAG TPA: DUF4345 domain-containing protein [Methyloceanibacter sp.]|nr:DUF4345 domain-containing protein [Methyloceanibacter sp.]